MESWREELYQTLSHSVEGSTWKKHKYVAIENGRYIYPEDLQNEEERNYDNNSKSATTTGTINGTVTTTNNSGTNTSNNQVNSQKQTVTSYTYKGSVKDYKSLPTDPDLGDVYLLENTNVKVYWDGEIWTPYNESETEEKKKTVSGGSKKTTEDVVDSIKTKRTFSMPVPSAGKTTVLYNGSNYTNYASKNLGSLFQSAVSAIKSSSIYRAGLNLINKIRGGSSSTVSYSSGQGSKR